MAPQTGLGTRLLLNLFLCGASAPLRVPAVLLLSLLLSQLLLFTAQLALETLAFLGRHIAESFAQSLPFGWGEVLEAFACP